MGKQSFSSHRFDKDHFILDFSDNEFCKIEITVYSESKNMYLADRGEMISHEVKWQVKLEYPERAITGRMILDFNDAFLYAVSMQSKYAPFQIFVYLDGKKQDRVLVVSNVRFPSTKGSLDIQDAIGVLTCFDNTYTRNKENTVIDKEVSSDDGSVDSVEINELLTGSVQPVVENQDIIHGTEEDILSETSLFEEKTELGSRSEMNICGDDSKRGRVLEPDSRFDTSDSVALDDYTPPNFYKIVAPLVIVFLVLVTLIYFIIFN